MIVLDTNVISAMMRLHSEPRVEAWLEQQSFSQLYLSAPVVFEIRYGIELLPDGRRRRALEAAYSELLSSVFPGQFLDLAPGSADAAGLIHARQTRRGRNCDVEDSLIAGIAAFHGAAIATRNADDFEGLGLEVIDPWAAA